MKQVTRFEELPEDVKSKWMTVTMRPAMLLSYNAGLRDAVPREQPAETPAKDEFPAIWDLCECGHVRDAHTGAKGMGGRECDFQKCPCTRFKRKAETPAPQPTEKSEHLNRLCECGHVSGQHCNGECVVESCPCGKFVEKQPTEQAGEIDPLPLENILTLADRAKKATNLYEANADLATSIILIVAALRKRGNS